MERKIVKSVTNMDNYVKKLGNCLRDASSPKEAVEIAEMTGIFSKSELMAIMVKKMHEMSNV